MGGSDFCHCINVLFEGTVPDQATGRVVNANLAEYHVAVHADAPPEFDIDFIDKPDPHMSATSARAASARIGIMGAPAARCER